MADLDIFDQLHVLRNSISRGDIDLLSRALADPSILSPADNQTLAESLGVSNGFLSWAVNVAGDPTVWIAGLLARRVPLGAWWRGGIPKRFTGQALEFGVLSKIFKPVNQAFRGTGMDKMIGLGLHRTSHIARMANPMLEATAALSAGEKVALVRFREEGVTAGLTEAVKNADAITTKFFHDTWKLVGTSVSDVRGGPRAVGKESFISYGPFRKRVNGELMEAPPMPRNFAELIPHLPILSKEGNVAIGGVDALTRMAARGGTALEQALKADGFGLKRAAMKLDDGRTFQGVVELGPWRVDLATDTIRAATADFQRMMQGTTGKTFFGHLKSRTREIPIFSQQGEGLFVTDLDHILGEYTRGISRTYAWNTPLTETERSVAAKLVENSNPVVKGADGRFIDAFVPERLSSAPLMIQIQRTAIESMGGKIETSVLKGTEKWHQPVRVSKFVTPNTPGKLQALDHLTKSLKGHFNEKEQLFGNAMSNIATSAEQILGRTPGGQAIMRKMATNIEFLKRDGTSRGASNFLASYSYYTTLGLNISTTLGNALQTPLTTMPALGIGATLAGAADVARRLPTYARELAHGFRNAPSRRIKDLPKIGARAWEKTFPELAEFRITVDPRAFDLDESSIIKAGAGGPGAPLAQRIGDVFKSSEDYLRWLLVPFSAVENANRAIGFFGARRAFFHQFKMDPRLTGIPRELLRGGKFLDDGTGKILPAVDEFINLNASNTVNATQFLPGGGTRTIVQDQVAPWMRTFSTFPIRLGSFMGESTVRGAMTEAELVTATWMEKMTGGRNFGVLAKMYVFGSIAQSGFRDVLGIDVNRYVGFGPLEFGGPNTLIGPVPIPPIAGAFITTGKALANREFDRSQALELPGIGRMPIPKVLVPGGVALSRLARAVNQWEPDLGGFVDDDGRLQRRAGTQDLIMSMLGIPLEKARRERIQLAQLNTRVGRVREMRRKFAMSLIQGEFDETERLSGEYEKLFPGMGGLNIEQRDLRTYFENARVPRLARRLQSFGKQQKLLLNAEFLEIAPEMIAPTLPGQNAPVGDLAAALAKLRGQ